uniref:ATP synthase complex subunit 8 n=1 Tax=Trypetoptera punctulata TaxID=305554 RepID=A0A6B9RGE6_TRYPU|nr:ATP synthase F0 subunit 8 [Trypetoptera punctulata]
MPQMAPISWLILFLVFSTVFLLFNILNYFAVVYTPQPLSSFSSKTTPTLTWKW